MIELSPAAVVQTQLDAYNRKDVAAILATYAPDAQQFEYPDKLVATGHDELGQRFAARFTEPNLHAVLLNRTVMGNTVIDHEKIRRTFPEGVGTIEIVAIYQVAKGLIEKARFIMGPKTIDS
jgi:hypothetical protein